MKTYVFITVLLLINSTHIVGSELPCAEAKKEIVAALKHSTALSVANPSNHYLLSMSDFEKNLRRVKVGDVIITLNHLPSSETKKGIFFYVTGSKNLTRLATDAQDSRENRLVVTKPGPIKVTQLYHRTEEDETGKITAIKQNIASYIVEATE